MKYINPSEKGNNKVFQLYLYTNKNEYTSNNSTKITIIQK